MIPDHLVDKAAQAIVSSTGSKLLLADMYFMDAAYVRADARTALETAAADIWDEGAEAGFWAADIGDVPPPNPYRASETA